MSTSRSGLFGREPAPPPERDLAAAGVSTWQMLAGIIQAAQMIPQNLRARPKSIAFTLVTGFLGSGKTTLINRLLAETQGRRLAVLVNDFGAINIDAALIRSGDSQTISLANGCVCCTLAAGLTRTLVDLAQLASPPEAVVLEASGIAEPHGILQVALANPVLRLDGVLTLVDAETIQQQMHDAALRPTIERQLGAADLLVLNKVDLVTLPEREQLRGRLEAQFPGARVIASVNAELPAEVALGIGGARLPETPAAIANKHDTAQFRSCYLSSELPLDAERVERFAQTLCATLIRAKGILCLDRDPEHYYVLQQVGHRWNLEQGERRNPAATRSELVMIGLDGKVPNESLRRSFEACQVDVRGA